MRRWHLSVLLVTVLAAAGCGGERATESPPRPGAPEPKVAEPESGVDTAAALPAAGAAIHDLDPPAAPGAFAPRLSATEDELLATWWESVEPADGEGRRLMFSRFTEEGTSEGRASKDRSSEGGRAGGWSAPSVVVEGRDFFANWADFPNVVREPSGGLLVAWLEKTGEATYAYSIYLARSTDGGGSWVELGKLNDDATDTEHGFVSLVPEGDAVRAYWLDGREMADGGPMTVRSARIGETIAASELLDSRVCECCPTDAVATAEGSMVVYRDRSEDETREIFAVRRTAGAFAEPESVSAEGWRIPGCPVNGPAIDHRRGVTAVAWFTGASGAPSVSAAFLGEGVSEAAVIDGERPLGRVGLALDGDGSAVVSWLAVVDDVAELRLRRLGPSGELGEALALGRTSAARSSGMPQLVRRRESFYAGWVEVSRETPSRIRVRQIPASAVPSGAGRSPAVAASGG